MPPLLLSTSSVQQQQLHHPIISSSSSSPTRKITMMQNKQARRTLTSSSGASSSSFPVTKLVLRWAVPFTLTVLILSYVLLVLPLHWRIHDNNDNDNNNNNNGRVQQQHLISSTIKRLASSSNGQQSIPEGSRCAINFYGLPRAFQSIVLPSLVKNIITPNSKYNCDYFVHYYDQTTEQAGRSGHGGQINPSEILLLKSEVEVAAKKYNKQKRSPLVVYTKDIEDVFWKKYSATIEKVHNMKDPNGRYLYFPWKAKTYRYPITVDNVLKMWHSIAESWKLMETASASSSSAASTKQHNHKHPYYDRVAMLRSDVVYVTPIDIWDNGNQGQLDVVNRHVVVPGFGKHPVSDRLVYGPYDAIRVWASERFSNMDRHVLWMLGNNPGWGLHSERFLKYTLFPAMLKTKSTNNASGGGASSGGASSNIVIQEHTTMCFFRARADETMWVSDCDANGGDVNVSLPSIMENLGIRGLHDHTTVDEHHKQLQKVVEQTLGRKCHNVSTLKHPRVDSLDCSITTSTTTASKR